jgi:hypothetical protein
METNKERVIKEFGKIFSEDIIPSNKKTTEIKSSFEELASSFKAFNKINNDNATQDQKNLTDYYDGLLIYVKTLKNPGDKLLHLYSEKRTYEEKIIKANINKNGYHRKFYKELIETIVNPLIGQWETAVKVQKELPINIPILELSKAITTAHSKVEKSSIPVTPKNVETALEVGSIISDQNLILPAGFTQIKCAATKEQVTFFFSNLAKENNPANGKPYMKQSDVDELIEKNFLIFGKVPSCKYFNINLTQRQKGVLKCFILEFYEKYELEQIGTKMKYVDFLIWNFELFKNDDRINLNKNMNNSNKPEIKDRISIAENPIK